MSTLTHQVDVHTGEYVSFVSTKSSSIVCCTFPTKPSWQLSDRQAITIIAKMKNDTTWYRCIAILLRAKSQHSVLVRRILARLSRPHLKRNAFLWSCNFRQCKVKWITKMLAWMILAPQPTEAFSSSSRWIAASYAISSCAPVKESSYSTTKIIFTQ